jgi:hypothetical protein
MRDLMDHTREVPIGATEMIRKVCTETLQSFITTFTNVELEIRVKRFTRTTEVIADYVGREHSKERRLLVNYQKENEPKERAMLDVKKRQIHHS